MGASESYVTPAPPREVVMFKSPPMVYLNLHEDIDRTTCFLEIGHSCELKIRQTGNQLYYFIYHFNNQHPHVIKIEPSAWLLQDDRYMMTNPNWHIRSDGYVFKLTALNTGVSEITLEDKSFFRHDITLYHELRFFAVGMLSYDSPRIANVYGWTATCLWSTALLTNIAHIFSRASVEGLSLDYLALQLLEALTMFLHDAIIALFPNVQQSIRNSTMGYYDPIMLSNMYFYKDTQGRIFNRGNENFYPMMNSQLTEATVSLLFTIVIIFQCVAFEKGPTQHLSTLVCGLCVSIISSELCLVIMQTTTFNERRRFFIPWPDFLHFLRYIGALASMAKYVPQLYSNFVLKSSYGWNLAHSGLEVIAWILFYKQMQVLASNFGDCCHYFGHPTEFPADLMPFIFNIVFITQYLKYWKQTIKKEIEKTKLRCIIGPKKAKLSPELKKLQEKEIKEKAQKIKEKEKKAKEMEKTDRERLKQEKELMKTEAPKKDKILETERKKTITKNESTPIWGEKKGESLQKDQIMEPASPPSRGMKRIKQTESLKKDLFMEPASQPSRGMKIIKESESLRKEQIIEPASPLSWGMKRIRKSESLNKAQIIEPPPSRGMKKMRKSESLNKAQIMEPASPPSRGMKKMRKSESLNKGQIMEPPSQPSRGMKRMRKSESINKYQIMEPASQPSRGMKRIRNSESLNKYQIMEPASQPSRGMKRIKESESFKKEKISEPEAMVLTEIDPKNKPRSSKISKRTIVAKRVRKSYIKSTRTARNLIIGKPAKKELSTASFKDEALPQAKVTTISKSLTVDQPAKKVCSNKIYKKTKPIELSKKIIRDRDYLLEVTDVSPPPIEDVKLQTLHQQRVSTVSKFYRKLPKRSFPSPVHHKAPILATQQQSIKYRRESQKRQMEKKLSKKQSIPLLIKRKVPTLPIFKQSRMYRIQSQRRQAEKRLSKKFNEIQEIEPKTRRSRTYLKHRRCNVVSALKTPQKVGTQYKLTYQSLWDLSKTRLK